LFGGGIKRQRGKLFVARGGESLREKEARSPGNKGTQNRRFPGRGAVIRGKGYGERLEVWAL